RIVLEEGKSREEKFPLKRGTDLREESARASLLKTVESLGGIDGLVDLSELEGSGVMQWTNNTGGDEQWSMTFTKRPGKDVALTFKSGDGQCTASIRGQIAKQDCKGGLRNGGDKIASDATSLFLSYQVQDVINALLGRPLLASETDSNRLE